MLKKNWIRRHKVPVFVSLAFLFVGFIAGMALQPSLPFHVQFEDKINGVELFGIFATIALVWIVTSTLDKHKNTEQNAKLLIAKRTEEVYELSIRLNEKVDKGEVALIEVTATLKRMSLTLKNVHESLFALSLRVDPRHKEGLDSQLEILSGLMTNTPVNRQDGPDCPLRIGDGILYFNESRSMQITSAFDTLRDRTTALQLAIYDV